MPALWRVRCGTLRDGGELVGDFLVVAVVDERGLTTRVEVFEVDAADAALTRFAELQPRFRSPTSEP